MIAKQPFGGTGHNSSRIIFGGYALNEASQKEADRALEILLHYGINHIDTAPKYGKSEERIGAWMSEYRDKFFLATKTRSRSYESAWKDLHRSLDRLQVDRLDLWQMHGLTNPAGWEKAMSPGGALKAFIEAREKGLVRFLGVTGHGSKVAGMHLRSLKHFDFDAVMLPFNYCDMQNPRYAEDVEQLSAICRERNIAVQTIKSIARQPWGEGSKTHNTYFYKPLESQEAIDKAVWWAMGLKDTFPITAGDLDLLPKMLDAAARYLVCPTDAEMVALVEEFDMRRIFRY